MTAIHNTSFQSVFLTPCHTSQFYCFRKAEDENKGGIVSLSVEIKVSCRSLEPRSASQTAAVEWQTSSD